MKFTCPECGKPLKVTEKMIGKRGRCPVCKATITAPFLQKLPSNVAAEESSELAPMPNPDYTFDVIQQTGKKEKWQLSLYSDRLILHYPEEGTLLEVLRETSIEKLKTFKLFFILPVLVVKDFKKFSYRLKDNEYDIINEWIGKPLLLKMTLKQRLSWCLPISIIYILTSVPLSGDPSVGMEAIPFDPVGMGLGMMLFALCVLMRKKPHPALFLADSVWFFLLLCYTAYQISEGASIYWGIVILLLITLIMTGVNHYKNFSDVQAVK